MSISSSPEAPVLQLTEEAELIAGFQAAMLEHLTFTRLNTSYTQAAGRTADYIEDLRTPSGELPPFDEIGENRLAVVGELALQQLLAEEARNAASTARNRMDSLEVVDGLRGRKVEVTALEPGTTPIEICTRNSYFVEEVHRRTDSIKGRIVSARTSEPGILDLEPLKRPRIRNVSRHLVRVVNYQAEPLVEVKFLD